MKKHLLENTVKNYKTIGVVSSPRGKIYTYKVPLDIDIRVDDYVVVKVGDELKIVQTVIVHNIPRIDYKSDIEYKWIVQVISLKRYAAIAIEERSLREVLGKKQTVWSKIVNNVKSWVEYDV